MTRRTDIAGVALSLVQHRAGTRPALDAGITPYVVRHNAAPLVHYKRCRACRACENARTIRGSMVAMDARGDSGRRDDFSRQQRPPSPFHTHTHTFPYHTPACACTTPATYPSLPIYHTTPHTHHIPTPHTTHTFAPHTHTHTLLHTHATATGLPLLRLYRRACHSP